MAASMFMNTNSLPVALMQSLVLSIPSLRWGEHDTTGAMTGRAFTYLVLYSSLSMMVCLIPDRARRVLIVI
jgi:predicted permease